MAKMVNPHEFMSPQWYEWTHNTVYTIHQHFICWTIRMLRRGSSVLEVGAGKYGWYTQTFRDKPYVAMDADEAVFNHRCAAHNWPDQHSQLWGSIERTQIGRQFDLVFSHAVIDHAPDPDLFIRKSIEASRKYIYIMSYRGYFPALPEHKIEKNTTDGYYYNDISIPQVRRLLDGLGHKYELQEVATGLPELEIQSELHIIVEK